MSFVKPRLSFGQIINMNFGFFGLQYTFGLQQANMSPIYSYLGADEGNLPLLWLAGPMTVLLAQPAIGALSDKTLTKWGRRTPYFLVGVSSFGLASFAKKYGLKYLHGICLFLAGGKYTCRANGDLYGHFSICLS
jgi:maltose/moltooligosaccharide transporter